MALLQHKNPLLLISIIEIGVLKQAKNVQIQPTVNSGMQRAEKLQRRRRRAIIGRLSKNGAILTLGRHYLIKRPITRGTSVTNNAATLPHYPQMSILNSAIISRALSGHPRIESK